MDLHQKILTLIDSTDLSQLTSPYLPKTFSKWRAELFESSDLPLQDFIQILDKSFLPKFLKKLSEAYQSAILKDPSLANYSKSDESVNRFIQMLAQWSLELELAVDLIDRARVYKLYELPYGYQDLFLELKNEWRGSEGYSSKLSQYFLNYLSCAMEKVQNFVCGSVKGYVMQNIFQNKGSILASICYAYLCGTMPWPVLALAGTQCSWIFSSVVVSKVGEKVCEKLERQKFLLKIDKIKKELDIMTGDLMTRNEESFCLITKAAYQEEQDLIQLADHFNGVLCHRKASVSHQKEFDEDTFLAENAVFREENDWMVLDPPSIETELVEDWMVIE